MGSGWEFVLVARANQPSPEYYFGWSVSLVVGCGARADQIKLYFTNKMLVLGLEKASYQHSSFTFVSRKDGGLEGAAHLQPIFS